ncbi:RPB7 polymerase, partial [Nicator chloris]|nr:RPB7 polymerase [Nicator chloris]
RCPQISLEHEILLHPRYFGPNLLNTVKQKLFTEVEGTCTGKGWGHPRSVTGGGVSDPIIIPEGLGTPKPPWGPSQPLKPPPFPPRFPSGTPNLSPKPFGDPRGPPDPALSPQSIPSEMEFDPNSNPPCYKTVDE